jgi:hypothetical protein
MEIVVMLPVFILLFLGVLHIHSAGLARQNAQSAARACACHYAVNGCTEEAAKDPICDGLQVGKEGSVEGGDEDTKQAQDSIWDELSSWPVFGKVVSLLFGEGASARSEQVAQAFVGDHDRKVSGRFYMVCNTVSQSWSGKISELLCDAANNFAGVSMPGCK